jgi:predicted RNA-binding Zn-ribbon protein involved in translation (DUF1610 family)
MKLLALRCPHCGGPLAPGETAVVVVCPQCRSAVVLADGGLTLTGAHYAAPGRATPDQWVPFWRFDGRVNIGLREAQNNKVSLTRWVSSHDAQAFWSRAGRFYIPAWDIDLPQASQLAQELIESQPTFRPATTPPPPDVVRPATLTPDDARQLLDLAVITLEARRSDWLKKLDFTTDMGPPALWLLPAQQKDGRWHLLADTSKKDTS